MPLARQVDPDHLVAIQALEDAGVLFTRDVPARFYPGRGLAAQVLGLVGWDGRGQEGVERSQDETLRGATYKVVMHRDRRGRALSTDLGFFRRAQAGDTVLLTLDRYIQQVTEDALDAIVERSEPLAATAVVLDVDTFEVLAMANRPTLNLNNRAADLDSLKNYAVAETYEPGSVLKPFVVALALEDGLVSPTSTMDCEGGAWRVGRRTIHDDHPHTMLTIGEVLK
ncbi:MAG: penicillin-binding protein, partial [Proteobacteria bacterium]|nr:penicillin-binding protein [Pseudomonadota bacterium]